MSVYASAPAFAQGRRHPKALLLIVAAHAVLIGAVMTAKMAVPVIEQHGPIIVDWIDPPSPPPPPEPTPPPPRPSTPVRSTVDQTPPIVPVPQPADQTVDQAPAFPNPGPAIGPGVDPGPSITPVLPSPPVRLAARFITPEWALRPPYPDDKRRLEEEAVMKLRLSIDERGRVVAVEPVGRADHSFLEAARKHLMTKWRYKPATEDGRPVPSSIVITLRFELE